MVLTIPLKLQRNPIGCRRGRRPRRPADNIGRWYGIVSNLIRLAFGKPPSPYKGKASAHGAGTGRCGHRPLRPTRSKFFAIAQAIAFLNSSLLAPHSSLWHKKQPPVMGGCFLCRILHRRIVGSEYVGFCLLLDFELRNLGIERDKLQRTVYLVDLLVELFET